MLRARARRAAFLCALGLSCAALVACSANTSPIVVFVRDAATHAPAQGVVVIADVPNKNHPLSVASLLGKTKETSSSATTDEEGRALLSFIPGRAVRLSVLAVGWERGSLLLEDDPHASADGRWKAGTGVVTSGLHQPEYLIESPH